MTIKRNGTVFVHAGLWYYAVKLPGEKHRRQIPLKAPNATHTLKADRPRKMAEEAAERYWAEMTRGVKRREGGLNVDELCRAYGEHAKTYYRKADGTPTSEVAQIVIGVRLFRSMFANALLAELTHADMMKVRDAMERSGVARTTVNKRVAIIKRMMSWALEEGLVPASVKAELSQVPALKRGRSKARETAPVLPVDDDTFEKTVAAMMPNTADMARLQRRTGMRPEEICALTWEKVDTRETPWIYRPADEANKNAWRGIPRVVLIGPRGREILSRHRTEDPSMHPFSPVAAMAEWFEAKRESAVSPAKKSRADPHTPRVLRDRWTTDSYTGTISAACRRAGVGSWSANQLRHAFATEVCAEYDLDTAAAVLGHTTNKSGVTNRYTRLALEKSIIKTAREAVERLG